MDNEHVKNVIQELSLMYDSPMSVVSDCLRGFIVPASGCDFIGADLNAIEARVTAWLAGETRLIDLYEQDADLYVEEARGIYHCTSKEVDAKKRLVGKVTVLSLGFGGGKGAFLRMAKNYGLEVSEIEAENIKRAWRAKNPNIVGLWYGLEKAAIQALKDGKETSYSHISYKKSGSFLLCRLPSGREIVYPYPKIELKTTPWGEKREAITAKWVSSLTRKWERRDVWYGILTENVVQAVARDLLVEALFRLEDQGYPCVMHVHDEVLLEVPEGDGSVKDVEELMAIRPYWATGLPIKAEGWRGKRYQK